MSPAASTVVGDTVFSSDSSGFCTAVTVTTSEVFDSAGPRATKDLADNGALVVKIESRKRLDLGRLSPPFKDGKRDPDGSAFFAQTNTSKLSVAINLGEPRGVEVAKALVAWADVVVENFSKGFLDRLGLSFEEMRAINPDVILVSVSVAGRQGSFSALITAVAAKAGTEGWHTASMWVPGPMKRRNSIR